MTDTLQEEHAAADHAMRNWTFERQGSVRIGSDAHKQMFCRMLLDTHNPYKPAVIDWPALQPAELRRLTSLPIWDIAVQTEGRASIRVATYAATVDDPLLRRALEMDGGEEARHKVVLSKLVEAYGIQLAPEPPYPAPKDPEWSWMMTGFSECIDSFFAFGLFRSAQRSGYFPPELVETFEPVIQEEGRHILFFVNWYAWHWRTMPWWRRPWFFARVAAVWVQLIRDRMSIARGIDADGAARDANFPATGTADIGDALNPRELIELCLAENDRRMAGYDKRLLRPMFVPRMARFALRFLKK
ncbi:aminomethyltransferase [Burkholderia cenocepacia]|uniref:aminomethyltransferase n=1 Tax=Burkholderia cenocepacia TaxID=95486 RepID=UPI000980A0D8|nr:aminomethyltransferase [Burkholderia cenocepacia]ONZ07179.1 aminomethyltransferase [Burkholderia cenocepacia]ONZ23576.1 aminomethyltransferase [Burkholderia cenocepacia]ONZ26993.1 aminomethyltransferase [Burkholderia cenocepacia]ONZ36140.1 aminomethyltransferase [Burkholderia cenocepacia]ONZ53069.1 aminomethyltransferase [Burkholderia cenocepacia]